MGLWATIAAAEMSGLDKFVCVVNGQPLGELHLKMAECGIDIRHSLEPLIPPVARNLGALGAKSEYLLFLDDHVLINKGVVRSIQEIDADIWHCAYKPFVAEAISYYGFTGIDSMVQGNYVRTPHSKLPHRIGSFTANCFAVKRKTWEALGGYWDTYQGFGGEEASFDLQAWAKGYEVWLDPTICVHHYSARSSERGYLKDINQYNYDMALDRLADDLPRLKAYFDTEGIPY